MKPLNNGNGRAITNPTFILILLASIAIMVMYVEAMAFPSLPMVMNDFGLTPQDYSLASWIITIYLVVGAVSIPVFGKLGDIYGKKKMLVIAMSLYTVAVTLTGFSRDLSDSIYVMIAFRAFQGLGMCMFPLAFSIIRDEFPKDRIAVAQGVISAMFGVGAAIGFVVGGYVTDTLGWAWTYHTVVPFIGISTILVAFKIRESPVRYKGKVDYIGASLLGATLVTFLVGMTETSNRGWTDPIVLSLLASSVVLLFMFMFWQTKAKEPLVRPSLMAQREIALTNIIAFLIGFAMFTVSQTIAALAGFNFGLGAMEIGLLNLPMSGVMLVLGPSAGLLVKKLGPKRPLLLGMVIGIIGFLVMYNWHSTQTEVMIGIAIMGSGLAFAMVSSINIIIVCTPKEETGISTGMNMIIRTAGSVVGPAVAAVIISNHSVFNPVTMTSIPDDNAYQIIFLMSSVFLAVGLFLTLLIRHKETIPAEGEA